MKIAITADLHLTNPTANPERFHALKNILLQCEKENVDRLIIAGDLFDKDTNNPAPFELEVSKANLSKLEIILFPGNHDPKLSLSQFTHPSIKVVESGQYIQLDDASTSLLLLPYKAGTFMGSELAKYVSAEMGKFVLISHGDWLGGSLKTNPHEPGSYMPLTAADLRKYQPTRVFLGHIHIPSADGIVMYPGSPCPLDITETGPRSFILYDSFDNSVKKILVDSDIVNFILRHAVIPSEQEFEQVKTQITRFLDEQTYLAKTMAKINLRLVLIGTSRNKNELVGNVNEFLKKIGLSNTEIQHDSLLASHDPTLERIAEKVREKIETQVITNSQYPSTADVLATAMNILYGE